MEHYYRNKEKILEQRAKYRLLNGQRINLYEKNRRRENIVVGRAITRLAYWRNKQKKLALKMFENELYKAYTGKS